MKKLLFIAVIFLISCSKEETQPTPLKVANPTTIPIATINIDGFWFDYTHIGNVGLNVPVKFQFLNNQYLYSEYEATNGWMEIIDHIFYRDNNNISMAVNSTNYRFFGTILTDSTIEITQYSTPDTLPSYIIHKQQ